MVKFGRHVDAFQNEHSASLGISIVPYNELKHIESRDELEAVWRQQLDITSSEFDQAMRNVWNTVYARISNNPQARGAPPSIALALYGEEVGTSETTEIMVRLKQIQEAAALNAEALRKLVKKHDKHSTREEQLSSTLIPLIYTSNFALSRAQLLDDIQQLRDILTGDNDSNDNEGSYHEEIVRGRQSELDWLKRLTDSLDEEELDRLVAHRGFHCIDDDLQKRPIENSLTAYETAWTSGIYNCECDIALTKDEHLVLAHDQDFSRLALNKNSSVSNKLVSELTFKELLSLPLTTIARPPLLLDVLRSAHAIGENAKLVIEIKPGHQAAASALATLLLQNPELMTSVSVIMSFDAYTMHKLRNELKSPNLKHVAGLLTSFSNRRALEDPNGSGVYPKLMLLTVADPPRRPCELQVGIEDTSPIDGWIKGSLDGVYMQFQQCMLEPDGAASLKKLSERYTVGIWGHAYKDPDDYETFSTLVQEGSVSFVNTDLPEFFRKGISVQNGVLKQ
jgi:glycerophosphoryl diester phosphodiesterase